ncbi:MAG: bifunctional phosphopantothenoylcysteine decarboxylase/phosphopantothenate--cysteine ligase CoaBC [Gammaproteobacteria bacterium]|nr:bifunctional phosphopantothenoylcysteine decarboxylase/phosphopantothenate--cysteine ligase CoaBC [Gammaproteobacteria bacterium]MYG67554.1 bifunctional phosphopantothenoylcysteine decarboxylase/phosphopantothenate--cysteine ligase CoaBC [Gammaproteobacteria bacterium]
MSKNATTHHRNRRVLVGVTGGIAAYKSPELVRRLIDRGCEVRVVMTRGAGAFITPLTLQAVSGHPVHEHLLDADAESGMGHIELARWAELVVVAPATANFIARIAHGQADDLLTTLVLATTAEVAVAPAMNRQMWLHPATQANLDILRSRDIRIIGPGSGDQACGETGPGRMTEPEEIASLLAGDPADMAYAGRRILVTAGPTWEALDPVRGITNHSSGKMGYALAAAAADQGAEVILVSGPVHLQAPAGVRRIDVRSADEMLAAVLENLAGTDVFVAVAAVSDFRPARPAEHKIKKSPGEDTMTLELVRNPDILATVAALDSPPFTVGFAAETRDTLANARDKLAGKGVDVIAANDVGGADSAFDSDSNTVTLVHAGGEISIPTADKYAVAVDMLREIDRLLTGG